MAAVIFGVKLRRGTLIHAESRKQRLDRERAASMTPLLCEQCGKQTTPTESEATPSEVRCRSIRSRRFRCSKLTHACIRPVTLHTYLSLAFSAHQNR